MNINYVLILHLFFNSVLNINQKIHLSETETEKIINIEYN